MYAVLTDMNLQYSPVNVDMRELDLLEIDEVNGAWVWAAVGAAAGFLSSTGAALQDGNISGADALSIAGATLTGAVGGRAVGLAAKGLKLLK